MSISEARKIIFAHIETCRPYTVLYIGLVGLVGASIYGANSVLNLLCAWLIPTLGWIAGLYGSDYFDRDLDAYAKPQRPIPSGRMHAITALITMCLIIILGALSSLLINLHTVILVIIATIIGILYSTVGKKHGLLGNILRGFMTVLVLMYGSMMVLPWPTVELVPLAIAFALLDTASNLMGSIRDIEGDNNCGYHSFAVAWGVIPSLILISIFEFFAFLVVTIAIINIQQEGIQLYLSMLCLSISMILIVMGIFSVWKMVRSPRVASYWAHTRMVLARILFAGSILFSSIGYEIAWLILCAFIITCITQKYLRCRHEFSTTKPSDISEYEVELFIEESLKFLNTQPKNFNWNRIIRIKLTDPNLIIYLKNEGGILQRSSECKSVDIDIITTGQVFSDIFLTKTSSPRLEYFSGRLALDCKPIDMIYLSDIFNKFTQNRPSGIISRNKGSEDKCDKLNVVISDTTLRDGEQMPGIFFTKDMKIKLAKSLSSAGVPLIEAGFPVVSNEEFESIRQIVDACPDSIIQVIARPKRQDVQAALDTGAGSIAIFIGTSPIHLSKKLGIKLDELLFIIEKEIKFASKNGRQVIFTAEDATRTPIEDLLRVFEVAAQAGAHSLGLADTVGIALPNTFSEIVGSVVDSTTLPVAVHCHNDIGLATANSLAAINSGASGVQCSILGIGERAGNAPLEQVLLGLKILGKYRTGINIKNTMLLVKLVSEYTGIEVPPFMPVVGANAFTHESGLHIDGILGDPRTYEPYSPDLIGRERHIVLGKHSGSRAVRKVADDLGIEINEQDINRVVAYIKDNSNYSLSASDALLRAMDNIGIQNL